MFGIHAKGVYPIAPTPFTDAGEIDWASTDRMVDWYREIGASGMTILGIMGEAPKLDGAEAVAFATRIIRRAEGLPVLVGVSAPGFAAIRSLARAAMDAGAGGVMIAQFSEPAAGQEVYHLHMHVMPRNEGVALLPPATRKEDPKVLEEHAARLIAALKG